MVAAAQFAYGQAEHAGAAVGEDVVDRHAREVRVGGPGAVQAGTGRVGGVPVAATEHAAQLGVVERGVEVAGQDGRSRACARERAQVVAPGADELGVVRRGRVDRQKAQAPAAGEREPRGGHREDRVRRRAVGRQRVARVEPGPGRVVARARDTVVQAERGERALQLTVELRRELLHAQHVHALAAHEAGQYPRVDARTQDVGAQDPQRSARRRASPPSRPCAARARSRRPRSPRRPRPPRPVLAAPPRRRAARTSSAPRRA